MKRILLSMLAAATSTAQDSQFRPWPAYQVIMWTGESAYKAPDKLPLFWQRMREMGVTAGMVHGDSSLAPVLDAKMPYYVENMVNKGLCLKWSSNVRDWDKWVTQWKGSRDEAGLVRQYCFDDPQWRAWARKEMQSLVRKNAPHAPLLYDIRDELSVTESANPFDYDFGPQALAGFREWLKKRYASLDALNAGWETQFKTWDDVKPFTTDKIKNRMASGDAAPRGNPDWQAVQAIKFNPQEARKRPTAWNLSPWCDHRTYMDVSLAATLGDLRSAARELDPRTPVGIEGTQMPSAFGGYDLWRLSQVLDWVEPYDICDSRAIFGSFMPGKVFLTTVGEQNANAARRRLWHLLLQGDKGCIIWWSEDCVDWKSADYALTPRAVALAPVLKEMRSPLAGLFLRAKRETDPIAIHYSQASVQVAWLIESTVDGSTWLRRFSSYEASVNKHARIRSDAVKMITDAGYTPVFLSSEQIEHGALKDFRYLVLPCSYAISDKEAAAISAFTTTQRGGIEFRVVASNGTFDEHGRLRAESVFTRSGAADAAKTHRRIRSGAGGVDFDFPPTEKDEVARADAAARATEQWRDDLRGLVPPAVEVPVASEVKVQRYRLGAARLIAFERNIGYTMGEDLKQRPVAARLEQPATFDAKLPGKAHAYDLRSGRYLGFSDTLKITVEPWQPTLIALTPGKLPDGDIVAHLHAQAK